MKVKTSAIRHLNVQIRATAIAHEKREFNLLYAKFGQTVVNFLRLGFTPTNVGKSLADAITLNTQLHQERTNYVY